MKTMQEIRLVRPDWKYRAEALDFMSELRDDNSPFNAEFPEYMAGDFADLMEIIESARLPRERRAVPFRKKLPTETYWLYGGADMLGAIFLTPTAGLSQAFDVYGNIGYVVRPSARRRGVAFAGVSAAAPMLGMRSALIGAYQTNAAGIATIEKVSRAFGGGMVRKIWVRDAADPLTRAGVWDLYYAIRCNQRSRQ